MNCASFPVSAWAWSFLRFIGRFIRPRQISQQTGSCQIPKEICTFYLAPNFGCQQFQLFKQKGTLRCRQNCKLCTLGNAWEKTIDRESKPKGDTFHSDHPVSENTQAFSVDLAAITELPVSHCSLSHCVMRFPHSKPSQGENFLLEGFSKFTWERCRLGTFPV